MGRKSDRQNAKKVIRADVAISGGGLVGLTLGIGLAHHGVRVAVVDMNPPPRVTDAAYDGRATAISYTSVRMMQAIGLWDHLAPHATPIEDIRVTDGEAPVFLHFDHRALGDEPMGQMVENRFLRTGLHARRAEMDTLNFIAPDRVVGAAAGPAVQRVQLESGRVIEAPVLVACEGRASPLRKAAGIGVRTHDYGQTAVVASIAHERPHDNTAHEKFLPDGPFAILPIGGNHSSLVWSTSPARAAAAMDLDDAAFGRELAARIGDMLGGIKPVGGRWCYPLSLLVAERFTADRLALVGDSAHGIHPIAGQGLNLGFRDVAAFIEVTVRAMRTGLDAGSDPVLAKYARWRRADTAALVLATDGLNRLFSNDITPVRLARTLGLGAVNRLPRLKNFFMESARGNLGALPRLLKGEAV